MGYTDLGASGTGPYSTSRQKLPKGSLVTNPLDVLAGNKNYSKNYPWSALSRVQAAKQRTQQRATDSAISDIAQLESLLQNMSNFAMPDLSSLKDEAWKSIAALYNPQISNLEKSMDSAKKRAKGAKRDIKAIFDDLVDYYEGQEKPTKERAKQYKEEAKQQAASLKQSIADDYAQRLREQVDLYKSLGIEAAVPSATEGQYSDQANALAVAENTRAAEEAALTQQEAADLAYWAEGAGTANREGAEYQADIARQLQAFLDKQEAALAEVKGQKKAAYHQAVMQLEQQAAESAARQQNELWNRMLELAKLKNSMSSSSNMPNRGLSGALAYLNDQRLGNIFQQYLAEAQIWGNSPQGKLYYGGRGPSTPEEWAQVIRDNAANKGLSPADQLALWQAALRYYGRG